MNYCFFVNCLEYCFLFCTTELCCLATSENQSLSSNFFNYHSNKFCILILFLTFAEQRNTDESVETSQEVYSAVESQADFDRDSESITSQQSFKSQGLFKV